MWNLVPGHRIISPQGRPQGSPPHIHTTPAPTMIRMVADNCQSFGDIQVAFILKGQASYAPQWNSRGWGKFSVGEIGLRCLSRGQNPVWVHPREKHCLPYESRASQLLTELWLFVQLLAVVCQRLYQQPRDQSRCLHFHSPAHRRTQVPRSS